MIYFFVIDKFMFQFALNMQYRLKKQHLSLENSIVFIVCKKNDTRLIIT